MNHIEYPGLGAENLEQNSGLLIIQYLYGTAFYDQVKKKGKALGKNYSKNSFHSLKDSFCWIVNSKILRECGFSNFLTWYENNLKNSSSCLQTHIIYMEGAGWNN